MFAERKFSLKTFLHLFHSLAPSSHSISFHIYFCPSLLIQLFKLFHFPIFIPKTRHHHSRFLSFHSLPFFSNQKLPFCSSECKFVLSFYPFDTYLFFIHLNHSPKILERKTRGKRPRQERKRTKKPVRNGSRIPQKKKGKLIEEMNRERERERKEEKDKDKERNGKKFNSISVWWYILQYTWEWMVVLKIDCLSLLLYPFPFPFSYARVLVFWKNCPFKFNLREKGWYLYCLYILFIWYDILKSGYKSVLSSFYYCRSLCPYPFSSHWLCSFYSWPKSFHQHHWLFPYLVNTYSLIQILTLIKEILISLN